MNLFLIGILAVVIVIAWPFILIWSLNTLFHLGILFTFKTWIAALILCAMLGGASIRKSQD